MNCNLYRRNVTISYRIEMIINFTNKYKIGEIINMFKLVGKEDSVTRIVITNAISVIPLLFV